MGTGSNSNWDPHHHWERKNNEVKITRKHQSLFVWNQLQGNERTSLIKIHHLTEKPHRYDQQKSKIRIATFIQFIHNDGTKTQGGSTVNWKTDWHQGLHCGSSYRNGKNERWDGQSVWRVQNLRRVQVKNIKGWDGQKVDNFWKTQIIAGVSW